MLFLPVLETTVPFLSRSTTQIQKTLNARYLRNFTPAGDAAYAAVVYAVAAAYAVETAETVAVSSACAVEIVAVA